MSYALKFFLAVIVPALAIFLVLMGVATLRSNPLGWFLTLVGAVFTVGILIDYCVHKKYFWEPRLTGATVQEEHGDRSFWFITAGMLAVFYLPPLEYLFMVAILPRTVG
jgi:membrane glycosyltransferase